MEVQPAGLAMHAPYCVDSSRRTPYTHTRQSSTSITTNNIVTTNSMMENESALPRHPRPQSTRTHLDRWDRSARAGEGCARPIRFTRLTHYRSLRARTPSAYATSTLPQSTYPRLSTRGSGASGASPCPATPSEGVPQRIRTTDSRYTAAAHPTESAAAHPTESAAAHPTESAAAHPTESVAAHPTVRGVRPE
jgi:hypothetical protein